MEWKEVLATDYCYKVADGTHDSPKRQNKGRFLITSKHIKGQSIDFGNAYYISEDDYQKIIKRSKIDKWDVIVSMIGEYCGFCYLEDSNFTDYAVKNVGILKVGERIKSLWLYYYLNSPDGRNQLKNTRAGSSQPYISLGSLRNLLIPEPPRDVMERTVSILSSLDRKIELNNKINADLEEMAQAIFKNWFVDFEPFKDGKFVNSELGMIPEGWKVGTLFDIAEIFDKKRKPLSGNVREKMDKIYPYYGATSCMDYVDDYIFDGIYTLIGEDGSVVKENGLPYMQYVWGKIWVNNHAHILQGKNGYSTEMIHALLSITNIKFLVTGAVQAKLSQGNMQKILVAIPPKNVLDEIRPVIDNLYSKLRINTDESSRLSLLRDTLLPRLMSGEIEVPE